MGTFDWQITRLETFQLRPSTAFGGNQGQLNKTQAAQLQATGFQGLRTLDRKFEIMRSKTVDASYEDQLCGLMRGVGIGGKQK